MYGKSERDPNSGHTTLRNRRSSPEGPKSKSGTNTSAIMPKTRRNQHVGYVRKHEE